MGKLICEHCGTKFNCGAPVGRDRCWCMDLPNLRGGFDLAQIARAISSVSYSHQGWKTAAGNWPLHHLAIAGEARYWQVCQPV